MAQRLAHRLRAVLLITLVLLIVAAGTVLGSGRASVVITHGISMQPAYHQGDLVILVRTASYSVGDIAAYELPGRRELALHRIIGGDHNGFILKGDNNQSVDALTPGSEQLAGQAVLHLPGAGLWLKTLTSPPVLGLLAFTLLAGGAATNRRRRRKQRKAAMSRTTHTPSLLGALAARPGTHRAAITATALLALAGLALGVPAWSGPVEETTPLPAPAASRMDFSYTADVGQSAAYDGTTATSPDAVFRKLTSTVDVRLAYHGEPGTMAVTAELSTPGGWHSNIPLQGPTPFDGHDHSDTVRLNLADLEAKAQAASAVTGLPSGPISIVLTPHVDTVTGGKFRPRLNLTLDTLQLTLAGPPETLTVTAPETGMRTAFAPRMLGPLNVVTARVISAALFLAALIAAAIALVLGRRDLAGGDEGTAIRRRYSTLLAQVQPVPTPHGRPVIDVATFPTLARLAESYGLLVLHWSRGGVDTFVVQDETITYRYRTGSESSPAKSPAQPVYVQAPH